MTTREITPFSLFTPFFLTILLFCLATGVVWMIS